MDELTLKRISEVTENYKRVALEVETLVAKEGLPPVEICAAVKTVSPALINPLADAGLRRIGENRTSEIKEKLAFYDKRFTLDYIGTLQSNKIRYLVGKVGLIQSLGSVSALDELERVSALRGTVTDCLIEINSASEENKSGVKPEEIDFFLEKAVEKRNVRINGLMTVGADDGNGVKYFEITKKLFDYLRKFVYNNLDICTLSMGMSGNYLDAVRCGSNMIRPGRVIFGERFY